MNKIYLFKDQDDYIIELTDDNVINVIGTKGSGKTTTSLKYLDNDDYVVINCDRLLEVPGSNEESKELPEIRKMLKDKYERIEEGESFTNCYNDIIEYIKKQNKTALIEGNVIQDINPSDLKGKVIIKRVSVFKSFIRAVKRDYHNDFHMKLEKEKHKYTYKFTRLCKITKRRKKVFKQAKEIEQIIDELDNKKHK